MFIAVNIDFSQSDQRAIINNNNNNNNNNCFILLSFSGGIFRHAFRPIARAENYYMDLNNGNISSPYEKKSTFRKT